MPSAAMPEVPYDDLPGFPTVTFEFCNRELAALEREFGSVIGMLQASMTQPHRANGHLIRQGLRRWAESAKWSPGKLQAAVDDLPGWAITKELGEALWEALRASLPPALVELIDAAQSPDDGPPPPAAPELEAVAANAG